MSNRSTMLSLIVDTRERALHKYLAHHSFVSIKQITHGDFNILINDRLMATIERKTIADYAASIKDGRTSNKNKLLSLRAKTNCQIYYIVEGHLGHRNLNTEFQGVKWSSIQNSMMHLRTEHYIFIERTIGPEDTVLFLIELCSSFMRREGFSIELGAAIASDYPADVAISDIPEIQVADVPDISISNIPEVPIVSDVVISQVQTFQPPETQYNLNKSMIGGDIKLLTIQVEKNRHEKIMAIWMTIPSVGMQLSLDLSQHPIILILSTDLSNITPRGKKLPKNAYINLMHLRQPIINEMQIKFLSGFPKIGAKKAAEMLAYYGSLSVLVNTLSLSPTALSLIVGIGPHTSKIIYDLIFTTSTGV